jgi:hypothetical protein
MSYMLGIPHPKMAFPLFYFPDMQDNLDVYQQ